MPGSQLRKNLLSAALALFSSEALAQNVFVTTIAPGQVQVIVDGTTVRSLRVGETSPEGVRLTEIRPGAALFEIRGRPVTLGLGQSTSLETTLQADRRGQFVATAHINGVPFPAMIDTGATYVVMNALHAQRLGYDFRRGPRVIGHTANGAVPAYIVTISTLQIGDVWLRDVPAMVQDTDPSFLPQVLIGMSFLRHVHVRQSGAVMTLSRPHLR